MRYNEYAADSLQHEGVDNMELLTTFLAILYYTKFSALATSHFKPVSNNLYHL